MILQPFSAPYAAYYRSLSYTNSIRTTSPTSTTTSVTSNADTIDEDAKKTGGRGGRHQDAPEILIQVETNMGPDPDPIEDEPEIVVNPNDPIEQPVQNSNPDGWCPPGVFIGVPLLVIVAAWDGVLVFLNLAVSFTGVGEVVLLVIEGITLVGNVIVVQLVTQSMFRDCADLDINLWPPDIQFQ